MRKDQQLKLQDDWEFCTRCDLCRNARKHVVGYGLLPADVVFIGEAPGETEDKLGLPFIGKAGGLLKKMFCDVLDWTRHEELESWKTIHANLPFRAYITNTVACAPWTDDSRRSLRDPSSDEAKACSPRLETIFKLAQMKSIVYLGKVSRNYVKPPKGVAVLNLIHPAAILRSGVRPESCFDYHKAVMSLREHLQSLKLIK